MITKKEFKYGFTLLELIICIVIIMVLASFVIPQYLKSVERGKAKEAIANLKLIASGERSYRLEYNKYYPDEGPSQTNLNKINSELRTDIADSDNWDYAIEWVAASSYTATATKKSKPEAPYANCTYTLTISTFGIPNATEGIPEPTPNSYCP